MTGGGLEGRFSSRLSVSVGNSFLCLTTHSSLHTTLYGAHFLAWIFCPLWVGSPSRQDGCGKRGQRECKCVICSFPGRLRCQHVFLSCNDGALTPTTAQTWMEDHSESVSALTSSLPGPSLSNTLILLAPLLPLMATPVNKAAQMFSSPGISNESTPFKFDLEHYRAGVVLFYFWPFT